MVVSVAEWLLLLGAGLVAGVINSVASGGSFFTYPAFLLTGLAPIAAATTTLAALTPGNLAAVPEYWPEVAAHREKYPRPLAVVTSGAALGIALFLTTGHRWALGDRDPVRPIDVSDVLRFWCRQHVLGDVAHPGVR